MISIPERINDLLNKSQSHSGFTLGSLANFSTWIEDNSTVFFPDYTDHGPTHLNEVLASADSLISDSSWKHLTPDDASALVISVLLHDCSMHLSEDGFYSLIEGQYEPIQSRYLQNDPLWENLWQDYLAEAKRFSANQLTKIFGDTQPVRNIPPSPLDLTKRDRLLIGEFVRRHHARLAHEIAINGIPGPEEERLRLNPFSPEHLDLFGFIARSHNMDLRLAVDCFDRNKRRVHLNIHTPFIMIALRIADYIQIHSQRANKDLLKVKALVSPISRGEWKKHHSILEINQAHDDPEALYIDAEPADPVVFESLRHLFQDIQRELDISWSVLGELYGRVQPLQDLGIAVRRIRSSLDNIDLFVKSKSPAYIPKVLRFRTAHSEIMDLLVAPLYGNDPAIGIRELIQNAVDACIERRNLIAKNVLSDSPPPADEITVTISNNKESGCAVLVEDFGIGMTLDTIENYFLNIGASFRNSDVWKRNHETDGHANIHRTGRFGVGLLAAFLLGNRIHVKTRHAKSPRDRGISFTCEKGGKDIIVTHCDFRVGTQISIEIDEETFGELQTDKYAWDWYCLSEPKVTRTIRESTSATLTQQTTVPECNADISGTKWIRIQAAGFDDVIWSFEYSTKRRFNDRNFLICNGIRIYEHYLSLKLEISPPLNIIEVETPSMVVFDPDGRLPINLQRSKLSGKLPFRDELRKSVAEYIVRGIDSIFRTERVERTNSFLSLMNNPNIPGLTKHSASYKDTAPFLISNNKLYPVDLQIISDLKPAYILVDPALLSADRGAYTSHTLMKETEHYLLSDGVSDTKGSRTQFVREHLGFNTGYPTRHTLAECLPIVGRRILLQKRNIPEIVSLGNVPKTYWADLIKEWENSDWVMLKQGIPPEFSIHIGKISAELGESQSFGFIVLYLDWGEFNFDQFGENLSPLAEAWKGTIQVGT